eukprot:CAMPEP_0171199056 /NCGR_PEP_ID=MMETSP0790-20130122/23269_1 /TAXON_ID=2925 /ORGANISM="Alexandrium catenella, Strain OF101" /LENGTH=78 /DNA_ID=CAMNT_0011664395 /DNA_START=58 /DNA_END=292 /DNA_ORIENTATION=-
MPGAASHSFGVFIFLHWFWTRSLFDRASKARARSAGSTSALERNAAAAGHNARASASFNCMAPDSTVLGDVNVEMEAE